MPGQTLLSSLCKSSAIWVNLWLLGLCLCGCGPTRAEVGRRPAIFEPATLRVNPTFTRLRQGDDGATRVETDVELADDFGDATKGGGAIYFELFKYRPEGVDVRGEPVGEVAFYDLSTRAAQTLHWQNVIRTYRFRLPWDGLKADGRYVLSATYEPLPGQGGGRLFDRLVVLPRREERP